LRAAAAAEMRSDDDDKGLLPLLFERSARTLVLFLLCSLSLSAFALLAPPWKERDREKEKKGALEEPRLVILQKRKKLFAFFEFFSIFSLFKPERRA
jgi:hypothetical protein